MSDRSQNTHDKIHCLALAKEAYGAACSVGFDRANMIGRSFTFDMVSITARLNALPIVLTPIKILGLIESTAGTRS
jgi:hypothetical protein